MAEKVFIPGRPVGGPANYPEPLEPAEVERRFRKLLGGFETPTVEKRLVLGETERLPGGVVRQLAEYDVDEGERVSAWLLYREGLAPDAPGVLSIHGHGGEQIFPVGRDFHCRPDPADPIQYSYRAALAGFRVLAPDALCFGTRRAGWGYARLFPEEVVAAAELESRGRSFLWKSVWDNSRALEVLEALGCPVTGTIGWSGGSIQNYALAAVNLKVRAAACFFSFVTLRHQFYQYRLVHCLYPYLPGMMAAGIDWDQVVALTAPRPLFLGWGARDEGTPEVMYRAFLEAVRARCRREGLPESAVGFEEPEGGHAITGAMLKAALDFLARALS